MNTPPNAPLATALAAEDFIELELILDDLRTRYDETPGWEFCEGFMAALICCRRLILPSEYLPVLLDIDEAPDAEGSFASEDQRYHFLDLWTQRWNEVVTALDNPVEDLEDERCYTPELIDLRSLLLEQASEEEREKVGLRIDTLPSLAQVWALGFMFVVETWPEEWTAPRDKDAGKWLNASLDAIVAMTEDNQGPPEVNPLGGEGKPPTASLARINAFADAIWATYDLREMWKTIGPRVETIRKVATPGRNDLCDCGSGKKYKKCHGAG